MAELQFEVQLRRYLKYVNRFHVWMWRLGMGAMLNFWPSVVGRYLVITHIGRKSGLKRRTSVNYAIVDDEIYCVAGFGTVSDWYRNIIANPQIEIWRPDGWWAGIAEDVTQRADRLSIVREVLIGSAFVARAAGFDPQRMTDEELDAFTEKYRLIHLRRIAARTGAGGPGDLAWVWIWATWILLPLVLWRRRKR
jgi:deazaflavin-dependent oxidoreductase (nitroreductase family)